MGHLVDEGIVLLQAQLATTGLDDGRIRPRHLVPMLKMTAMVSRHGDVEGVDAQQDAKKTVAFSVVARLVKATNMTLECLNDLAVEFLRGQELVVLALGQRALGLHLLERAFLGVLQLGGPDGVSDGVFDVVVGL